LEHRRKILRHCRGSDTHANIFSDPNRDSHSNSNCDSNAYGHTYGYTKALARTETSSHTSTAPVEIFAAAKISRDR